MTPSVELRSITKRFGNHTALSEVSLAAYPGTIHAIVGENGAGKTTLMRILYGALRPTSGEIFLNGERRTLRNAQEGIAAGIGMVSQHYSILSELTCLQNLILGAEPGSWMDLAAAARRAQDLAARMGFEFDWRATAETLSPASAQKLEILKLLWRDAKVLILDEPTAMLTPADSDLLYGRLRKLAEEGATVLVVTHRLPEVLEHARHVTVLRGGRCVQDQPVAGVSSHQLAEWIVGHAVEESPPLVSAARPQVALGIQDLSVRGHRGNLAIHGLSTQIKEGEVVGVAGVDGSGQRELFQAILGLVRPVRGEISLNGSPITRESVRRRFALGVRLIAEDRHEEAVVDDWPLESNAILGLQRLPSVSSGPWLNHAVTRNLAGRIADRFHTRHPGLNKPMRALSGGNQQRFVAARALQEDPRLILAFAPTRGLDIDASRAVYAGLREACRQGAAALIVSFDLDELLEHCDRVIVLCNGRLSEPPPDFARDRAAIGRLMVGAAG